MLHRASVLRSTRLCLLACLLFVSCWAFRARADDVIALEWNVPKGARCPTSRDVLAQVSKLVESSPPSARAIIRAHADVRKLHDGGFRVELTTLVDGVKGQRIIEERSCSAMAEATALILAWMVDPSLVEAPSSTTTTVHEPAPRRVLRAAPRPKKRQVKLAFGPEALVDLGTLPSVALGGGLEAAVRWKWLRVQPHAALWPHRDAHVAGASSAGASLGLTTLGIDVCGAWWLSDIALCGGLELDRMEGTGFGVDTPRTNSAAWLAFDAGIDGRLPLLGPLGITGRVRLLLPTRRERFGLDDVGVVHQPGKIAGRAVLGLNVLF